MYSSYSYNFDDVKNIYLKIFQKFFFRNYIVQFHFLSVITLAINPAFHVILAFSL